MRTVLALTSECGVALVVCALGGCLASPSGADRDADARAAVFQYLVAQSASALETPPAAFCLEELKADIGGRGTRVLDPEPAFLARFTTFAPPVLPASACVIDTNYVQNEPARDVVRERVSGARALLLTAGLVDWYSDTVASLVAEYRADGLNGATYTCHVVRRKRHVMLRECVQTGVS